MREPSIGDTMTQEHIDAAPRGTIVKGAKSAAVWSINTELGWAPPLPATDSGLVLVQWGWGSDKPKARQHHRRKYP